MATRRVLPDTNRAEAAALISRIKKLYVDECYSTYRIATTLGIDRQRVARILKHEHVELSPRGAGRPRPERRLRLSAAASQDLEGLYVRDRRTSEEIGALYHVSGRTVRRLLREQGIRLRTRGWKHREDRVSLQPDIAEKLYLLAALSADEVGKQLGCSRQVVLRLAHDLGWPVRIGGPISFNGPEEVELICALYSDAHVMAALHLHRLPSVPPGGPIWLRFPVPVDLAPAVLRDLYLGCGLSTRQVELLTGVPAMTVAQRLRKMGIALRPPGGRSPFLRRWRAEARRGAEALAAADAGGTQ